MNRVPAYTCAHGHIWTPANTHIGADGKRRCRTCKNNRHMQGHHHRVPFIASNDVSWMDDAACRQCDPELWFPTTPGPAGKDHPAVMICAACPVFTDCAVYAGRLRPSHGIWAGKRRDAR